MTQTGDDGELQLVSKLRRRGRENPLLWIITWDHAAWSIAIVVAAVARLDFRLSVVDWSGLYGAIVFGVVALLVVGSPVGLYRHRHPVGTHGEFRSLALTVTIVGLLTSFAYAPVMQILGVTTPRSLGVLGAPIALLIMAAGRSLWRSADDRSRRPDAGRRTVVLGAGNAGQQIVRALLRDGSTDLVPVAIIDDDPRFQGRRIDGLRVAGTSSDLVEVANEYNATVMLLAAPTASAVRVRELVAEAEAGSLDVRVLPPINEIVNGRVGVSDIRELTIADLLQREQAELDVEAICDYVQGRRVLVTGAGGSIGSELSRQLSRFGPAELYMLDRDESALLSLQLSIDGRGQMTGSDLVLADLRDRERIEQIFDELRPEVVFHAAALKHVPLLENHPVEGLKTNVLGTLNVLEAARSVGVDQFVNISTDKAADPENVLGYSKRIAERLTAAADHVSDGDYKSVRFGNVLGSRGSVLSTFESQIKAGGPVTVTHPDVTRFFMTVEEAVRLVIQAGAVGSDGEVLVLDMGEPVRIVELARTGVKRIAVLCPAFVADCLETLEEIGMRADQDFRAAGGEKLILVPSVNSDDRWAEAVATLAREVAPCAASR